jgi:hypothetical protein
MWYFNICTMCNYQTSLISINIISCIYHFLVAKILKKTSPKLLWNLHYCALLSPYCAVEYQNYVIFKISPSAFIFKFEQYISISYLLFHRVLTLVIWPILCKWRKITHIHTPSYLLLPPAFWLLSLMSLLSCC